MCEKHNEELEKKLIEVESTVGNLKSHLVESEIHKEELQGKLEEKIIIGRTTVGSAFVWPTFIDKIIMQALANGIRPSEHLKKLQSKPRQSAIIFKAHAVPSKSYTQKCRVN